MKIGLSLVLSFFSLPLFAKTWQVGPGRTYTFPSQVSGLVGDGDTVAIDAGVYLSDVARWTANDLLLTGAGGLAHLKSQGNAYGGKAIWVITGQRIRVEYIEFSECQVPDQNGAGIRFEGAHLSVRHCYFHDNENGMLINQHPESVILVEHCEFDHNGAGDGYSHNLYVNAVAELIFQYNYSHRALIGHELKSRARMNRICYNRLSNESDGQASREIDLSNGGLSIVLGNIIEQGPLSENSGIIGYGLEGLPEGLEHTLYLVNNTVVNHKGTGLFVHSSAESKVISYNNLFVGAGGFNYGGGSETAGDLQLTETEALFADPENFDFHLLPGSPAIDAGVDPDVANTDFNIAEFEYQHPLGQVARTPEGAWDCGAYEYHGPSGISLIDNSLRIEIFPNPSAGLLQLRREGTSQELWLILSDPLGHKAVRQRWGAGESASFLDLSELPAGLYWLRLMEAGRLVGQYPVLRQ